MNTLQTLEWAFRHRIAYPVLRRVFRNEPYGKVLDISRIRSVLILRYDRFGDMIVTSPITRHLKSLNPSLRVGLAASMGNVQVAKHLPGVDEVHVVAGPVPTVLGSIMKSRNLHYDCVLNFILNRTTTGGILANTMAPEAVKVGQGDRKYAFYFNRMVTLNRGSHHMVNLLDGYCQDVFGRAWGSPDLRYGLDPDPDGERRVEAALKQYGRRRGFRSSRFVVLNISAGEERRHPSLQQMIMVARHIAIRRSWPLVVVGAPGDRESVLHVKESAGSERVKVYPETGMSPFMDMFSLIRRSALLVSPDTSLVHAACAAGTPAVSLYASPGEFAEWSPVGIPFEALFDTESGVVRTIAPERITDAFDRLAATLGTDA